MANRIYVTGDTHREFYFRCEDFKNLVSDLDKSDYLIVCGDFGLIWDTRSTSRERYEMNFLNDMPWTTLFADGNHENYYRLNQDFPIVDFHDGKAHKISNSIYHLMRGEMYDIYDNKIFTFGGARSHDIWNLLDPQSEDYECKKVNFDYISGEFYREIGISWWEDEVATSEELRHGWEILKSNNWKCDYIITHEAPLSDIYAYYKDDTRDSGVMAEYLEAIKRSVDFKLWYYGHHHVNVSADPKTQCLFHNIKSLGTKSEQIVDNVITEHTPFSQRHLLQLIDKMEQERKDVLNGKFQSKS